jgi:predicted PurR-regulated permease PerM
VDLSNTLKAWVAGQLLAMSFLAVLTALGLWLLRVPYALAFGAFTGAVAVIPFFGTIVSTLLPAMFVLTSGNVGQSVAVVLLGVLVHLVEANIVAPLIFEERIKLPPVLTILSVLVAAKVLGVLGLIVSVPLLASAIVIVRHVLISQIYGDLPAGAAKPAVLVPTQEHRFLTIP